MSRRFESCRGHQFTRRAIEGSTCATFRVLPRVRRDSLFDAAARHEILKRLGTLKSDSAGLWGTMSIGATLCHMADQLRFAIGELEPRGPHGPLTWRPVQWFGIVVIPWVKGRMDTSPELLQTEPAPDFESDRRDLGL